MSLNMTFFLKASLIVQIASATPRIRLEPEQQTVRPGDSPLIRCEVTQGDPPVRVTWSREAAPLPRSVTVSGPVLQFRGIAVSDAGRYVCRASNSAGQAEAVAEVIVLGGSQTEAGDGSQEHQQLSSSQGATVDLPCRLSPSSDLSWSREGGLIPEKARQMPNNMLRIEDVSVEDSGRYECTAGGRVQYVTLRVESMTLTLKTAVTSLLMSPMF